MTRARIASVFGHQTVARRWQDAGKTLTIAVNSATKVNGVQAMSLADLAKNIGHKVQVQATRERNGSLVAWKVTVEGETGDQSKGNFKQRENAGTIASIGAHRFAIASAIAPERLSW